MAPVATEAQRSEENGTAKNLKEKNGDVFDPSDLKEKLSSSINPFYSPPPPADNDDSYEYDRYRV